MKNQLRKDTLQYKMSKINNQIKFSGRMQFLTCPKGQGILANI